MDSKFEKILDDYINVLKYQKKYSEHTTSSYKRDIYNWIQYTINNNIDFKEVKYQNIQSFLYELYNANYTKTTINRILSSLRGFYKYLYENSKINNNPFENVSSLKKDKKLPNYLYTNEIEQLLNIDENDSVLNKRNELIIELLYDTGIRVSELVNIKISHINKEDKTIKILGKGKKERIVMYGEYCDEKLNEYLNNERILLLKEKRNEYLLLNSRGEKISDRSIRNIIKSLTAKTNIKSHVTPHTIRHTFATHMLNEGADLTTVKDLLGHKNLSTTSIYTHLSKEHLRNVYYKSHPRAKE